MLVSCTLFIFPSAAHLATNYVDLAALALCESGTTNGWTVNSLANYTSANNLYKPNINFKTKESYAESPNLRRSICRLEFDYRSSSTNGRQLIITNDKNETLYTCDYSNLSSDGMFTNCVVDIIKPYLRCIIFKYNDGGERTTWSLANLKIITKSDLSAAPNGEATQLRWQNNDNIVSNRVDIYRVNQTAGAITNEIFRYDLSKLQTDYAYRESSAFISLTFDGRLQGRTLYLARDKPGILQISNSDTPGILLIQCPKEKTYTHLRLSVCRSNERDKVETSLSWVQGAETNIFEHIKLTDSFKTNYIPIDAALNKDWLCLNAASTKSNSRVLISDIAFVTIKEPEYKNIKVYSQIVEKAECIDVKNLTPHRAHYFTVTSFTADGTSTLSEPSEWFYPLLPPGFLFMVH